MRQHPLTRRGIIRLAVVSGVATALSGLTACGQAAPPAAAPTPTGGPAAKPAAAAKPVTISFWPRNPSESSVVWEKLIPIQQKLFPNLTVNLEPPAEDYNNKLLVAFAGGTAPDAGVNGLKVFRAFVGRKMLKEIQTYVDGDSEVKSWLPEYVPAAIKGYSHKGQLYCVPTVNESILVFYDKDAIVKAGLTPPREIEDDPKKWNWDTMVEYGKKLTVGKGFRRERFGIVATAEKNVDGMAESWGNLFYARGGRMLDVDGEKVTFNSPEVKEGVQYITDLIHKYDVHPDVGESSSAGIRDRAFFQNGQAGIVVQGEYFRRYLWGSGKPSAGFKFAYDMAMMPFCPATGKRTNIYHGNGSFMLSQTKNPDATWNWLKVIFTKEAQQIITDNWGSRGGHKGTYEPWLKSNAGGGPEGLNYQAIVKADTDTDPYPTTPYLTQAALLEPVVRIMYDNVFQNKMSVGDGLAQIEKEMTAALDKGKKELETQK